MKRISLPIVLLLLCAERAIGDSIVLPYPYVSASINGKHYFKMGSDSTVNSGTMYEVKLGGTDSALWSVAGWYAYTTYVPVNDGEYLIRLGDWFSRSGAGFFPKHNNIAIAFYKRGELIRSYSTAELVRIPFSVTQSSNHFRWIEDTQPPEWHDYFLLSTLEGREFTFDYKTGVIRSEQLIATDKDQIQWVALSFYYSLVGVA